MSFPCAQRVIFQQYFFMLGIAYVPAGGQGLSLDPPPPPVKQNPGPLPWGLCVCANCQLPRNGGDSLKFS